MRASRLVAIMILLAITVDKFVAIRRLSRAAA